MLSRSRSGTTTSAGSGEIRPPNRNAGSTASGGGENKPPAEVQTANSAEALVRKDEGKILPLDYKAEIDRLKEQGKRAVPRFNATWNDAGKGGG